MPEKTFTISELAQEFDVTTRTIRFYEEKGLIAPLRDGQKRIYSPADRVRIKLILRGKRIGMSLRECVEVIDMYDPENNNREQLNALLKRISARRQMLQQQKTDIDHLLEGLTQVESLCRSALLSHDDAPTDTLDEPPTRSPKGAKP